MRKLIITPRKWGRAWSKKVASAVDDFLTGPVPLPPMLMPPPFGPSMADRQRMYGSMMGASGQQDLSAAFGGQGSLAALLGQITRYPYSTGKPIALQEGKVDVHVKLIRIDEKHVLVEVECIRRIVHNKGELRELTAKLIEEHAEEFLFSELARKDIASREPRPDVAKEPEAPPGAKEPVEMEPGSQIRR